MWAKSHLAGGRNRGSPISVPLALREGIEPLRKRTTGTGTPIATMRPEVITQMFRKNFHDLPALGVFDFLGLFQPRKFLGILRVFCCFCFFLVGGGGVKFLGVLGGFPWLFTKRPRNGRSGFYCNRCACN